MGLKPAICTQCGASIEVDDSKEAGICRFCGTAFITEKVIANYTSNYTTVNNITNHVTKIINGEKSADDAEVRCNNGLTNLKLKKYYDAADNFEKAIKAAPEVASYYMYKHIADTKDLSEAPYWLRLDMPNDVSSFFALATEEEKQKFAQEYGLDFSCYEAFLIAEADALYLKKNFCGTKENAGGGKERSYNAKDVRAVVDIFDFALKQEEYLRDFREKVYQTVCNILKDRTPGAGISYMERIDCLDMLRGLRYGSSVNRYDPADYFCICLYKIFSGYIPDKAAEMYDLLAQRMFYADRTAGVLYLKSSDYLPVNFAYGTKEKDENGEEFVTIRVEDESIHTIVFGEDCSWFGKFVLTPNITEVQMAGIIAADFSTCQRTRWGNKQNTVKYFGAERGCNAKTAAAVESCFKVTEKIKLAEQEKKKREKEASDRYYEKLKREEKAKKTAIWLLVALGIVAFIAFIIFGMQTGL